MAENEVQALLGNPVFGEETKVHEGLAAIGREILSPSRFVKQARNRSPSLPPARPAMRESTGLRGAAGRLSIFETDGLVGSNLILAPPSGGFPQFEASRTGVLPKGGGPAAVT